MPTISQTIELFTKSLTSLRCIEKIHEIFEAQVIPCWKTAQNWILQLGLYKLTRKKFRHHKWSYLIDFKSQAGHQKCLIILGFNLDLLKQRKEQNKSCTLSYEDLEPIEIILLDKADGRKICSILEQASLKTGVPIQCISDGGSNICKAIKLFSRSNPNLIHTYDIIHKLDRLLIKHKNQDEEWQNVSALLEKTRQKIKQSPFAYLSPPTRYEKKHLLAIRSSVKWLGKMQDIVDASSDKEFLTLFGWIKEKKEIIKDYNQIIHVIDTAKAVVNKSLLHKNTWKEFKKEVGKLIGRALDFAKDVIAFLKEQTRFLKDGEVLLGSSEILESVIGRYSFIQKRCYVTKSITSMILSIAAFVGKTTSSIIAKALGKIPIKEINEWKWQHIGVSDLSKRRQALGSKSLREKLA